MPPRRTSALELERRTLSGDSDRRVVALAEKYIAALDLPVEHLRITTDRQEYSRWLGRRISSSYGGAYCFLRHVGFHAILINLDRIDVERPQAIEVVVAEELVHMRDHLDGDRRRHSKHGYDRIAHRVAELTGASLETIRNALIPVERLPYRYVYACPSCHVRVPRKRKGTWSCGRCSPVFDSRYVLRIVEELPPSHAAAGLQ